MESVQSEDNRNASCSETNRGQHLLVPDSHNTMPLSAGLARAGSTQRLRCVVCRSALDRLVDFALLGAQPHRNVTT